VSGRSPTDNYWVMSVRQQRCLISMAKGSSLGLCRRSKALERTKRSPSRHSSAPYALLPLQHSRIGPRAVCGVHVRGL
jgi:hypothetical protein